MTLWRAAAGKPSALLDLLLAVAEQMTEGVAVIRAVDGVIVQTNRTWDRLFGYEIGEMAGRSAAVLSTLDDDAIAQLGEEIRTVLQNNAVWRRDVQTIRKDGTPFWCSCNLITLEHPQYGDVWVVVHNDITEYRRNGGALSRALAALRRPDQATYQYGQLTIDPQRFVVEHHGRRSILTRTEWLLFSVLLAHPGRTLSRCELATLAWGGGQVDRTQEVEVYISRLRRKVETVPSRPTLIETVRGRGYRLIPPCCESPERRAG